MMCIACEQGAMWVAYLQRKDLVARDGHLAEQPPSPFAADPVEPIRFPEEMRQEAPSAPAAKNKLSSDDPTAG
jgi:hypothetical protein